MKRLTIIFCALFLSVFSYGQLDSVKFSIGGTVGFNMSEVQNSTTSNFSLALKPAYHFSENIAAGVIVENSINKRVLENTNSFITATNEVTNNNLRVGLFGRYYKPVANRAYLFGELNGGYVYGSRVIDNGGTESTDETTGYSANILLGASYFFTPRLSGSINVGMLGFKSENINPEDGDEVTRTTFSSGIDAANPSLSVRLFF